MLPSISSRRPMLLVVTIAVCAITAGVALTPQAAHAGASTPTRLGVRGGDGAAWAASGNDSVARVFGGGFFSLAGGILGSPAVVSVPLPAAVPAGPGTPYYIATGGDHNLWVRSEALSWQPLSTVPLNCLGSPGATSVYGHAAGAVILVVACEGGDGALWFAQAQVTSNPAQLPTLGAFQSLGGVIASAPAIAAVLPAPDVPNELTFFATAPTGRVWTRTLASGWSGTPWGCVDRPAAASVVLSNSTLAAFACQGPDQAVWQTVNPGTGWAQATSLGGGILGGPGIALTPNSLTIVAEGVDQAVWQISTPTGASAFSAWSSVGGGVTDGATAAGLLFQNANP
jgi:hypothetical protein